MLSKTLCVMLGIMLIFVTLGCNNINSKAEPDSNIEQGWNFDHPHTARYEIFEVTDSETGNQIFQLFVEKMTDNTYDRPVVRISDSNSNTWQVIFSRNPPVAWSLQKISPDGEMETVRMTKIANITETVNLYNLPFDRIEELRQVSPEDEKYPFDDSVTLPDKSQRMRR